MMYFSGTIADVIEDGATATLILDTGEPSISYTPIRACWPRR